MKDFKFSHMIHFILDLHDALKNLSVNFKSKISSLSMFRYMLKML